MKEKNLQNTITRLVFYFVIFSFLGWLWEVLLSFIVTGQFVNRGTLFGPWTPIYGFGGVSIIMLSEKFKKPWQLFLGAFVISGILEYFTALFLEEFHHAKWWDYSMLYFNFQGRICLEYLLVFAIVACVTVYFIVPQLDIIYYKCNQKIMTIVLMLILIAICVDFGFSIFNPNSAAIVGNLVPRVGIEPALYP